MYSKEEVNKILKLNPEYKGKGLRVVALEGKDGASKNSLNIFDKVHMKVTQGSKIVHDDTVGALIKMFKPECELFLLPNSRFERVEGLSVADWIIENDIDIVNMSQSKSMLTIEDQNRIAKHCFIITSAGNKDELGESLDPEGDRFWWQVGAIRKNKLPYLIEKYGQWMKFAYSAWKRDAVDGATLSEIDTPYGNMGGTSGAAPIYTVQIMEYMEVFKRYFNRKPSINMTIDFIDRHSHNMLLEDNDSDLKLGYGLLVLPEKYHFEEIVFEFESGKHESKDTVEILKDGYSKTVDIKQVAKIIDGSTYLPVRQLSDLLGIDIEWNNPKRQVIVRKQQGDH